MKRLSLLIIIFFILALSSHIFPDVKFKGLVQSWFSFGESIDEGSSDYGFTLRRVRFKPYGSILKNVKWSFLVAWDRGQPSLVTAQIDFHLAKELYLTIGRISAPGSVSGTLTPSSTLDLIERPMVSQKWGTNAGLSGFRSIGIQASGNLLQDKLYYAVMVANSFTGSLFDPSIKSADYNHENNGFSYWARTEIRPLKGLRVGAFYGDSQETDTEMRRHSYGLFLFYVNNPLNLKIEYIAGLYGSSPEDTRYKGMYAVLGYNFNKFEPLIRYGFYEPGDGTADSEGVRKYSDITLGINIFYSQNVRFQVNYLIRYESMAPGFTEIRNNLFYVCFQCTFP